MSRKNHRNRKKQRAKAAAPAPWLGDPDVAGGAWVIQIALGLGLFLLQLEEGDFLPMRWGFVGTVAVLALLTGARPLAALSANPRQLAIAIACGLASFAAAWLGAWVGEGFADTLGHPARWLVLLLAVSLWCQAMAHAGDQAPRWVRATLERIGR